MAGVESLDKHAPEAPPEPLEAMPRPVEADGVVRQQTTVSGTPPRDGETRELAVGDSLRRGRALLAA